jgi:hypothetical protein
MTGRELLALDLDQQADFLATATTDQIRSLRAEGTDITTAQEHLHRRQRADLERRIANREVA